MLTWIADYLELLLSVIPRITAIEENRTALRCRWGKFTVVESGRWFWYWPVSTTIQSWPSNLVPAELPQQALTTNDGHTIMVTGIFSYRIKDFLQLTLELYDAAGSVDEIVAGILAEYVRDRNLEDLVADSDSLRALATEALEPYAVTVERFWLVDLVTDPYVVRHYGIRAPEPTQEATDG